MNIKIIIIIPIVTLDETVRFKAVNINVYRGEYKEFSQTVNVACRPMTELDRLTSHILIRCRYCCLSRDMLLVYINTECKYCHSSDLLLVYISALDAAKPDFDVLGDDLRLDPSDAIFVDSIHTDGEPFNLRQGEKKMFFF